MPDRSLAAFLAWPEIPERNLVRRWLALPFRLRDCDRIQHGAQRGSVDELDVTLASDLERGVGEIAAGHEDRPARAFADHDAEQLMHVIVRNLARIPPLALHDDVFVVATQLEVDSAVVLATARLRADVFDTPALAAIVIREQRFETGRVHARQRIIPTRAIGLE